MKKPFYLYFFAFVLLALNVFGQSSLSTDEVVRKVADHILKDAEFAFEGIDNHVTYTSSKDIPANVNVKYKNKYVGWHYTHGVLNMAMLNLGNYLNNERYSNFARQHVAFGFDNYKVFEQRFKHDVPHNTYPYGEFFAMNELDDFGAMAASVMEVYNTVKRPEYKTYVEKAANHLEEERLRMQDGTLVRAFPARNTLWGDDLYMSVPFLVRMYKLSGNSKYLDDAIKQVVNFNKYLWDDKRGIYYHCYFTDSKQNGVAHWGRCNGWIALAQVHLLNFLPANHPMRKQLIQLLQRQIIGLSRYQDTEGLWHQLLDKENSYAESSCSAMFVYTIARAVNEGWINKRYTSVALAGWEGLVKNKVTDDGQLKDICVGTEIRNDLQYYYQRPVGLNETHGLGALLDAGVEIMKLQHTQILETGGQKPMPNEWIDKDTHHKVIRLSRREGNNSSFYFHNNPFIPQEKNEGDRMVFYGSDAAGGRQAFTVNLKTLAITQITNVPGRIGSEIIGHKTNTIYYQLKDSVFAVNIDTKQSTLLFVFPADYKGNIATINADETILAGAKASDEQKEILKKYPEKSQFFNRIFDAHLSNDLFIINIKTAELKKIHTENTWLGHVQFSPVDPNLLMFCHEGPWHKVDRIWHINIKTNEVKLMHKRNVENEIAGHEFFSPDGKTIWFDLQIPKSVTFYLAGTDVKTGKEIKYQMTRDEWSIHFNISPNQKLFAGDGGDSGQVAKAKNGRWLYLFMPDGDKFKSEKLVNMQHHNYKLEPNVHFSPDGKWIIFRANFEGQEEVYAVEIAKSDI